MKRSFGSIFLLFIIFGCVDRLFYDIPIGNTFGISISGHISDEPGPYRVNVFRNFDVESRENLKTGVTAESVMISDAEGNSEMLSQVSSGVYETPVDGLRGKVGGVYKVTVGLSDGRTYESVPDTLKKGGVIDSVYYELVYRRVPEGTSYDLRVYANSVAPVDNANTYFMWENKTTYKTKTKPEDEASDPKKAPCYMQPNGVCNYVHPCSGILNVGSTSTPDFRNVHPCECCFCWYDQYNPGILLSDNLSSAGGRYRDILVDRVELTGWNMMFKMRLEVSIQSLSPQAYRFWKGVRDQRSASTNIFQPITGKITGNIIQTGGPDYQVGGIFYATSVNSKVLYVKRDDVDSKLLPSIELPHAGEFPCFKLAPNATTTLPSFWIE